MVIGSRLHTFIIAPFFLFVYSLKCRTITFVNLRKVLYRTASQHARAGQHCE